MAIPTTQEKGKASMGRASRLKAERKAWRLKHQGVLKGMRVDERGAQVPATVQGYEEAAARGPNATAEALLARHNARMNELADSDFLGFARIRSVIAPAGPAWRAIELMGARNGRAPSDFTGRWADQVAWGLDSVLGAARLVFAGQLVGAAMLVRQQLERWTENLAFNAGTAHLPGETQASYIQRIWQLNEPQAGPGSSGPLQVSAVTWNGHRAGEIFTALSELTHGRGPASAAVAWDAAELCAAPAPSTVTEVIRVIADATALVIARLRTCVESLAYETGRDDLVRFVTYLPRVLPAGAHRPPAPSLWPLVPKTGLSWQVASQLQQQKKLFDHVMTTGSRPAGRLFHDDEMFDLLFASHRARAVETAMQALETERARLGHDLDLDSIHGREQLYVFPSEIAGLVAAWHPGDPVGDAAAVAGSSLRTAYWLWLEDDDRAMAMLRITLEAVARLRTWRLKPAKAVSIEQAPDATPRDWLEASGLRRLSALNRALGELSHFRVGAKWTGARDLIIELQPDDTRGEHHEYTGRGAALDRVAVLLFRELIETVKVLSPTVAADFSRILAKFGQASPQAEKQFDKFLDHAWDHRKTGLGESTFTGPANDRARLHKLFGVPGNPPVPKAASWIPPSSI